MPKYRITGPDGATYEVTAPEGASEADILDYAKTSLAPQEFHGPPQQPESGGIIPFSRDETGKLKFPDWDAGITGALKRAVMAPGEVWQGKLNPFSEEGQARATETALVASPTSAASRAGVRVIPGEKMRPTVKPKAPTPEQLKASAKAGYDKVDALGVDYSASAVKSFADDAMRALDEEGLIAALGPKTHAIITKLQNPPAGSVASLRSLDAFRRQLNRIAGSPDATEAAAAGVVIRRLDKFLESAESSGSASVVAGPSVSPGIPALPGQSTGTRAAEDAAAILRTARGDRAAAFRSDRLTGVADAADLRAAAANSGRNLGNTLRSRLASLLLDERKTRGFNEKELAAIRQVVEGTASTNTLRYVSNLLGAGGGLGQSAIAALGALGGGSVGGLYGGAVGATLPAAAGAGARTIGNKLTANKLARIDELTRMRSPLGQQLQATAPFAPTPEMRMALLRALLAAQGQGSFMGGNPSLMGDIQ